MPLDEAVLSTQQDVICTSVKFRSGKLEPNGPHSVEVGYLLRVENELQSSFAGRG